MTLVLLALTFLTHQEQTAIFLTLLDSSDLFPCPFGLLILL